MDGRQVGGMALALAMAAAGMAFAGSVSAAPAEPGLGLDWLAGVWCGERGDARIEEAWWPEAGGALVGMSRTVEGSAMTSFEFMRIVGDGGRPAFHVQPNGTPPTVFAMAERGDGRIRFANPEHDFPNVVEYRREGDRLHAWIAGPGPDGSELRIPFEYRACDAGRR